MKLILFLILLFSLRFGVFGQDSVYVMISPLDNRSHENIPNVQATIESKNNDFYASSGYKGVIRFYVRTNQEIKIKLSHALYLDIAKEEFISKEAGDTLKFMYSMERVAIKIEKELVVYGAGTPEVIFGSDKMHVDDFELLPQGNILLLTYQKRLKKGSELKIFNGQTITSSFQVPGHAQELIHDFRTNPHVVCEENIYGIHYDQNRVGISTLDKGYFMTYVAPIVDTNHTKMYFSNFSHDYPAFDYFIFDQWDSTYRKVIGIEDELMMEHYLAEYKWVDVRTKLWAKNKELQTGIDAEIWVGANIFTQSIYYKEAYAPMFHRNDSLFVFNYHKDLLFTFNANGEILDSVPIYHHYNPRSNGWKRNVLQDDVTGEIFTVYEKAGYTYIGRVDVNNGEIPEKVRLEHQYIEKIQIRNNKVYYVYRPFESPQKKYLYSEGLPNKYNPVDMDFVDED